MKSKRGIRQAWLRWKNRYRFQIVEEETYEVKFILILNRLNVFVVFSAGALILVFLTYLVIAFTPLRQYIPGYGDVNMKRELIRLQAKADNLDQKLSASKKYQASVRSILNDEPPMGDTSYHALSANTSEVLEKIEKKDKRDSMFRKNVEERDRFAIVDNIGPGADDNTVSQHFLAPVHGKISKKKNHSVQISCGNGVPVSAVLDGYLISSSNDLSKGSIITLQHDNEYVTIYSGLANNSYKVGRFVKAGEVLAFTDSKGKLGFELWYKGRSLDPAAYINFQQ